MDGSTRNGAGINYSCEARRCLAGDLIFSKAVGFILINIDRIVRFVFFVCVKQRFHNHKLIEINNNNILSPKR